jgi:hypothetical protein
MIETECWKKDESLIVVLNSGLLKAAGKIAVS